MLRKVQRWKKKKIKDNGGPSGEEIISWNPCGLLCGLDLSTIYVRLKIIFNKRE